MLFVVLAMSVRLLLRVRSFGYVCSAAVNVGLLLSRRSDDHDHLPYTYWEALGLVPGISGGNFY